MSLTQTLLSKNIVGPNPRQIRILGQHTDTKIKVLKLFQITTILAKKT